ncbi:MULTISPECIES: Ltp family lipoprotein [unclassified Curtobacterium]|uniref:Ltp family lipoprotein n=1 Tax=unclassified Curtobacterium TaxID=257496 RepID=UPI0020C6FE10|nr:MULTISPECIES: Ltp family lipoprotein [unclassified Curtobacterium]
MTTPEPQGAGMSQTPPPFPQYQGHGPGLPPSQPGGLTPKRAAGLAIAALVVGIAAFLFGLIPVFGALVGIAAIILAVLAIRRQQSKGLAVTGLVLGILATLSSVGTAAGLGALFSSDEVRQAAVVAASPTPVQEQESPSSEPAAPESEEAAPAEAAPAQPDVPADFTSALNKAESYSELMHMSKAGIYDQLTSEYGEKFSPEAAQYAVDTVQVDWNANALAKAKDYQSSMSMSPDAIRDQLTSEFGEKFLPAEADYAMAHLND